MKIGYFADGPWSHLALERILEDECFEIAYIVPRYDTQDPVLKKWADRLGVDYLCIADVNSEEALDLFLRYKADLMVSMSFNQILKEPILKLSPLGFINCHAGQLPFYRGRNILNWALINGADSFGVTVHYVDTGIDTGDIIAQSILPIRDEDNYPSLLEQAVELCAKLLYESLCKIENDNVIRINQSTIHPVGFYCGRRRDGDEWIDWSWPSRRIFNFIRAITYPAPCAQTILNNKIVNIEHASMIKEAPNYIGVPGEVVGKEKHALIVKTGDTTLRIEKYEIVESTQSICVGQRFGLNLHALVPELISRVTELEDKLANLNWRN